MGIEHRALLVIGWRLDADDLARIAVALRAHKPGCASVERSSSIAAVGRRRAGGAPGPLDGALAGRVHPTVAQSWCCMVCWSTLQNKLL